MREIIRHCQVCEKTAVIRQTGDVCQAMNGWIVLSQIHDNERFDCLTFCSVECLQEWLNTSKASVPDIFRLSFGDNE